MNPLGWHTMTGFPISVNDNSILKSSWTFLWLSLKNTPKSQLLLPTSTHSCHSHLPRLHLEYCKSLPAGSSLTLLYTVFKMKSQSGLGEIKSDHATPLLKTHQLHPFSFRVTVVPTAHEVHDGPGLPSPLLIPLLSHHLPAAPGGRGHTRAHAALSLEHASPQTPVRPTLGHFRCQAPVPTYAGSRLWPRSYTLLLSTSIMLYIP